MGLAFGIGCWESGVRMRVKAGRVVGYWGPDAYACLAVVYHEREGEILR